MKRNAFKGSIAFTLLLLLLMSTSAAWGAVTPVTAPQQIVLSLTGDPAADHTKMAVTWCDGESASDAAVTYSANADLSGALTAAAVETASGSGFQYFEAVMTGLTPGQTYYYKVGAAAAPSAVRSFTAGTGADSYEFIYLGDVQFESDRNAEYDAWQNLVQNARTANPNAAFLLQGGGMVNSGQDPEQWQALLTRGETAFSGIPFMSVPGSQEGDASSGKPELWSEIFRLPENGPAGFTEEFYSFDYGDSHILCLNSNILSDGQLSAGTMTEADFDTIKSWISADLAGSAKTWKIAVLQHPPYGVTDSAVSAEVLREWAPIFEDNGVSLVLSGGQHAYMRTFPMFDREISTSGGITYIIGNSGSKFYPGADLAYDAELIENTSTYQLVSVSAGGIAVTAFDTAGSALDAAVITAPAILQRSVTLDYDASAATVTASPAAMRGDTVTVQVSNLAVNKRVSAVTVRDRNDKSYPVTTLTTDSSYSFTMPNRSVTVRVTFENTGGTPVTYYNCTFDNGGDPIWNVSVSSPGSEGGGSGRISAGSAVTVTVTRQVRGENEALSASLEGLEVRSGVSALAVTTVSTTNGSNGTVKSGTYSFTMPAGAVTVSPVVDYADLRVYARANRSGSYTLKGTLSRNEMVSLAETGAFYYTGYDRFPTAVIGKATQYITLEDLLEECGVTLTENSEIYMSAPDGGTRTFTYGQLYGQTRYCYPHINTGSSANRTVIEPIIAVKGYQSRFIDLPSGSTINDMPPDTFDTYRFAYGQTEAQFNGGTPSLDTATVYDFLKWTDTIKVTLDAGGQVAGGAGGAVIVEAKAVIDAAGKASVTLEADAVKSGLTAAVNAAKESGAVPAVKFNIELDKAAKSAEITLPGGVLKDLAAPDKLLLTVSTPFGDVALDAEALKAIQAAGPGKDVTITIAPVTGGTVGIADGRELTDTVADITLTSGGKAVTGFGNGKLKIQIPFTPDSGKKVKGYYVVWLTEDGRTVRMTGASYQQDSGAMEFETDHLSRYAVAYTSNTAVNVFSDIGENAWYAGCVSYVTEKGYFQGTGADVFSPAADMSRAMFVTVLGRASGVKTENYTASSFSDAAVGSWYGGYVQWAYENKIISGVGGGRFAPDQAVTREQMAAILANYSKWKGETVNTPEERPGYPDADRISGWAAGGVVLCTANKWLTGYPDGSFRPQKTASRAEVAQIIYNIYNEK